MTNFLLTLLLNKIFLAEVLGVPNHDVVEISNYVAAMEHGLKRIQGGFPLSLRLIREMHEVLLNKGRGSTKQPGEFRTSQIWIGGTRLHQSSLFIIICKDILLLEQKKLLQIVKFHCQLLIKRCRN